MKKVVLIDGNSIVYRAFFALPLLNNKKGIYTNAIYGFANILLKIMEEENPTHIMVAFDAGKTTFRHKTFGDYKGGRQSTPPELSEQFPFVREMLNAFSIKSYELPEYEADDIIGTLVKEAESEGMTVTVVSGDKDMVQLVSDSTTVSITKKGITDVDKYTPAVVAEKYELTPNQIIDMKGLMGDKSDNIPGVPGVGEKTAIKLLKEFTTVENVYDHIDEVSGKKLKERLVENKDSAYMSKKLATINCQSPIEIHVDDIERKEANTSELHKFFEEMDFQTLLRRLGTAEGVEKEAENIAEISFQKLEEVKADILKAESTLFVEVLQENYHHADIQGFALVNETGNYFIPTDIALQSDVFKKWLESEETTKNVFDMKRAMVALYWKGVDLKGIAFDSLIASYVADPTETNKEVKTIAAAQGYHDVLSDEEVYGKGAKQKIPSEDVLAEHIVRKAIANQELKGIFEELLKKNEQYQLLTDLEQPLAIVLAHMECLGIKVDTEHLQEMGVELSERLKGIEEEIYQLAGTEFNINSPKQLGVILFENLQLPALKKTKTGYSTSADVLEKLKNDHDIIAKILDYRQLGKLYSTYVEGLLKVVNAEDSKAHTRFNQVLTQTGRLSSTDPNLQNIPIRMEEGRKIRQAFVPSQEDWVIFAADYSQIELRVLAHISGDESLQEAFRHDMDIHTKTAMDVFHVEKDEVTSNMRRQAKAVNFGIVYGISDYGLSQNLDITRKEAGNFIEAYLKSFPGVKEYMSDIVSEAKLNGYVTTLLHRRRYIPEITSRNFNVRSFAERTAMNTPIQGSAADIIKLAMLRVDKRLKEENAQAKLLLQVHDELIFEAPQEELELLKRIVPEEMEHAIELSVPLKVDSAWGKTWYDAK